MTTTPPPRRRRPCPLRGQGLHHIRTIGNDSDGINCIHSAGQQFTLDADGSTRQTVIDNLSGTELTATLRSYVDRINSNPDDAPLQVGTGKELDEAAARHVLTELVGDYTVSDNFPVTLTSAFFAIGMATPTDLPKLDPDPHRAVHQCLFLLATAVNRLRHDAGTGHGRPGPPRKTTELSAAEARLVARATALVAGALLDKLDGS